MGTMATDGIRRQCAFLTGDKLVHCHRNSGLPHELMSAASFYAFLGVETEERAFLEKHAAYRYRRASIPKRRGGTRTLLVPERRLKFLQRKTLLLLQQVYSPRVPVHGF